MVNDHCPYAGNAFCASLPSETRGLLCEHCHIRTYPKGMLFPQSKWKRPLRHPRAGPDGSGPVRSAGKALVVPDHRHCLQRHLAERGPAVLRGEPVLFDVLRDVQRRGELGEHLHRGMPRGDVRLRSTIRALYRSDIGFVQNLFWASTCTCAYEGELFMQAQTSAYSSVKYVLDFCRRNQVPELTHAQIALHLQQGAPRRDERDPRHPVASRSRNRRPIFVIPMTRIRCIFPYLFLATGSE